MIIKKSDLFDNLLTWLKPALLLSYDDMLKKS